jgi:hypothetical protein
MGRPEQHKQWNLSVFSFALVSPAPPAMLNLFSLQKTPKTEATANKVTAAELRLTKGAQCQVRRRLLIVPF